MPKILVLYYSTYGHVEKMAESIAEGVRKAGVDVVVKRVEEMVPEDVARKNRFKVDQSAPVASPDELPEYDGFIVGAPTRFGCLPGQMANFWDRTGGLWAKGALVGKVGAVFTSTASQHGGQEVTLFSLMTNLLHHGMVISGLPYSFRGQLEMNEVVGGAPYGATTLAGGDGSRQPSQIELDGASYLGEHVANIVKKLA